MNIDNKIISSQSSTYFIADIAANHDGDIERAKDLIYLAADSGADAAKFQHFQAKSIVSDLGFKNLDQQSSHQSAWGKSVYEVYEDASVDLSWTKKLKETCDKAKITFFTTPYDLEIVEYINNFVPAFKIGSGDITWHEIIEKVANIGKPYLLATGASSLDDISKLLTKIIPINNNLCLMQCNTNYTADLENFKYINLNVLKTYKAMYPDLLLGLSDHTPGHSTVLGAVALGAKIIEKHFTDKNDREGPDHKFSMNPKSWEEMVNRTRELDQALGHGIKKVEDNEKETVILQRRAIRAFSDIKAGDRVSKDNTFPLRPCPMDGIPPFEISKIEGKILNKDIKKGDIIRISDFN